MFVIMFRQVACTDRKTQRRYTSNKMERRSGYGRGNAVHEDGARPVQLANLLDFYDELI